MCDSLPSSRGVRPRVRVPGVGPHHDRMVREDVVALDAVPPSGCAMDTHRTRGDYPAVNPRKNSSWGPTGSGDASITRWPRACRRVEIGRVHRESNRENDPTFQGAAQRPPGYCGANARRMPALRQEARAGHRVTDQAGGRTTLTKGRCPGWRQHEGRLSRCFWVAGGFLHRPGRGRERWCRQPREGRRTGGHRGRRHDLNIARATDQSWLLIVAVIPSPILSC
jgi:hypothetical protein